MTSLRFCRFFSIAHCVVLRDGTEEKLLNILGIFLQSQYNQIFCSDMIPPLHKEVHHRSISNHPIYVKTRHERFMAVCLISVSGKQNQTARSKCK